MSWMVPSEKLLAGISVCNNLDTESFRKLIDFGYCNAFGTEEEKDAQKIEIQNNQSLVQLGKQINLTIKTVTYLIKRLMVFIASPETILTDLTEKLNMDREKSEILIKFWMSKTRPILDGVSGGRELTDVQWDLRVELSSTTFQKSKTPLGMVRLQTADTKRANFEMDHDDLSKLYTALENVQDELDLLKQNTANA